MVSNSHDEVRKLLKEFGVSADETVIAYILQEKPAQPLHLRIVLEDQTEYESPPTNPLRLEVRGIITPPPA